MGCETDELFGTGAMQVWWYYDLESFLDDSHEKVCCSLYKTITHAGQSSWLRSKLTAFRSSARGRIRQPQEVYKGPTESVE